MQLSQMALIDCIINDFRMAAPDCQPVSMPMDPGLKLSRTVHAPTTAEEKACTAKLPYCALIGCLMYVAIGTRPNINHAVQNLSQFLDCYNEVHWEATKC